MSKHTPGPWHVNVDAGEVFGLDGYTIIQFSERFTKQERANAQLIAAGPEMFRDLKALVALVDTYAQIRLQTIEAQDMVARARLTIAKAEGRD